jgi:hypothetical protein
MKVRQLIFIIWMSITESVDGQIDMQLIDRGSEERKGSFTILNLKSDISVRKSKNFIVFLLTS